MKIDRKTFTEEDHVYERSGMGIISEHRDAGRIERMGVEIERADTESGGGAREINALEKAYKQNYIEKEYERFSGKVVRTVWVK